MNHKIVFSCLLSLLVSSAAFSNPVATAKYSDFAISYGFAADYNGDIYAVSAPTLKPIAVSFKLAGKKVSMSFLDTSIILRIKGDSLVNGARENLNTYSLSLASSNIDITDKFSIGLTALKPLIRDSMGSTVIDWGQLVSAFTLVNEDGHKLAVAAAPFFRTNMPFSGDNSQQFWMPVKATYSVKFNKLSFSSAASYIPIENLTTDKLSQMFILSAGAEYKATKQTSLFIDGQLWLAYAADDLSVKDQLDLTYVLGGMKTRF